MDTLIVIGTRPEAIKLAPVVRQLRSQTSWRVRICATGQHREMLATALEPFKIQTDVNLELMRENQSLADLTSSMLQRLGRVLENLKPDVVLVQGDTTSTFAGSLAAFYAGARVGHIEAGLRTGDRLAPWPEEANRRLTTQLADWHFAPTESARANLLSESIADDRIFVTGNTVVDALDWILASRGEQLADALHARFPFLGNGRRLVLATLHRRENQRGGVERVCRALRELARRKDVEILFPVHPNPSSNAVVRRTLGDVERIHLAAPLDYLEFVAAMSEAHLIISDSGGVQEEAPCLGVPVLVTREKTERPEAVEAGSAILVGTDVSAILEQSRRLLDDPRDHGAISLDSSPFGDGRAAGRIVDVLQEFAVSQDLLASR